MAGLSTKAIKTRIKSMASTRQITKAMELVASSKLRSAQSRAVACRPYFTALYEAMNEIADSSRSFESPYLRQAGPGKTIYIVIAATAVSPAAITTTSSSWPSARCRRTPLCCPSGRKRSNFSSTAAARSSPRSIARRRPSPLATVIALQSSSQTVLDKTVSKRRSGLHEFRLAPRADARRAAAAAADDLGGKADNAQRA